jgi:hypothetical protein
VTLAQQWAETRPVGWTVSPRCQRPTQARPLPVQREEVRLERERSSTPPWPAPTSPRPNTQTAKDTTAGPTKPMGERDAHAADHMAEAPT